MYPKLYALCTVKVWKSNTPAPNTHILCVLVVRHFGQLHGSN